MDKETQEFADRFSRFVNSRGNIKEVIDILSQDHRTLQQSITRFCVGWLEECAKKHQGGDFDLRNQASCELGKVFVEKIESRERAMPFI